jgi:plasmid stabilization system protein ParE
VIQVVVRQEAETDLQSAFDWYEARRAGLGLAFREAVNRTIARVAESPRAFPSCTVTFAERWLSVSPTPSTTERTMTLLPSLR